MKLFFTQPPVPLEPRAEPTKLDRFGAFVDRAIGVFNPAAERARMEARVENERARLQYNGARSGRDRAPAPSLQAPNSPGNQVDSTALLRRAGDQQRNNSFVNMLVQGLVDFTIGGDFKYIPTTSNDDTNNRYMAWLETWYRNADARGNHQFIDLLQMGYRGVIYQGNHGFIHHHNEDFSFQISSVRGQNIGNPLMPRMDPYNIQGVRIDAAGRVLGYDIWKQTIFNQWIFSQHVPNSIFSHLNPVESDDDYKCVSLLKTILNDTHDMARMELAWMKKLQNMAAKNAVVNIPNGSAPSPSQRNPNGGDLTADDYDRGVSPRIMEIIHGETMYGEPGMSLEVVKNETPTDQEMAFAEYKMQQIAGVLGLPLPFMWMMVGASVPGTMTRAILDRARRTFQEGRIGQKWLVRVFLREIITLALLSGINRGEIPFAPDWTSGDFLFTASAGVDVGNESDARLNENRQGITSRSEIIGLKGRNWKETDRQVRAEAKSKLIDAITLAKEISAETKEEITWQQVMPHIQLMTPNGNEISSAVDKENPEEKGGAAKKSGDNASNKQ